MAWHISTSLSCLPSHETNTSTLSSNTMAMSPTPDPMDWVATTPPPPQQQVATPPPAATPERRTQEGPSLLHLVTSYLVECSLTFARSLAPALLSDAVTTATDTIATDLARQTSSVSDEPIPATAHRDEATATTKRAAPHDQHAPQRSDSKQRARS